MGMNYIISRGIDSRPLKDIDTKMDGWDLKNDILSFIVKIILNANLFSAKRTSKTQTHHAPTLFLEQNPSIMSRGLKCQ